MNSSNQLTAVDRSDLRRFEKKIEIGVQNVGLSLMEIRDRKLYREKHKSFEDYCESRWGFKKSYAHYQIQACQTRQHLSTMVDENEVPTKERHLREISKAPKDKQAEVLKVAKDAAATEDREPTVVDYRKARRDVCDEPVVVTTVSTKAEPQATGNELAEAMTLAKKVIKSDFCGDFVKAIKRPLKAKGFEVIQQVKGLTVEQIEQYATEYAATDRAKEKGWPLEPFDADSFFDYYAAQGWKLSNGNALVDWQSAVRGWGRRSSGNGKQTAGVETRKHRGNW